MTQKEKGATPFESAPQTDTTDPTAERERGLYPPLLWAQLAREVKPAKFRGKTTRKSRADAIRAKRNQGAVDSELVSLLALATVGVMLLAGGL